MLSESLSPPKLSDLSFPSIALLDLTDVDVDSGNSTHINGLALIALSFAKMDLVPTSIVKGLLGHKATLKFVYRNDKGFLRSQCTLIGSISQRTKL